MKAVIFDLDDTLYPEMHFVESGFRAVSDHLFERFQWEKRTTFRRLMDLLQEGGRGEVFQRLLTSSSVACDEAGTESVSAELLWVYRTHRPRLQLYPESLLTLQQLRASGFRLGLITDGKAAVQHRKIDALGIRSLFDAIVCTDDVGAAYSKPHRFGYQLILRQLQTSPQRAAYVGDDPSKDFVYPNQIGMVSIQLVRRGQNLASDSPVGDPTYHPTQIIHSLHDTLSIMKRSSAA